jgi:drug/metabolite transporter (DMT)-like permease
LFFEENSINLIFSTPIEDPIEIEVKENDNEEQFIDPLIEPIVVVDIDQPIELSPTITQRFSGILYAFLAAFLFTLSVFVTKQLNVELFYALIPRFLFQIVILIIYMKLIKHYSLYKQKSKHEIFIFFIIVFFNATGSVAFFLGYRYLPLPDLITIRYTQVIWTTIIIAILYREKPSIPIILGVLLTTIGVIFVAQPKFLFEKTSYLTKRKVSIDYQQHLIGLFIAFYAAIAMSITIVSNKYLLSKYKTKQSLIMLQLVFSLLCVFTIYLFYKYYSSIDKIQFLKNNFLNWKYLCASSICSLQIISSILMQKAVKREHPSIITIVQSSDILFAILLQNIFSSIKSNFLSLFGSILVLTSILIISGYKLVSGKKNKVQT